MSMEPLCLILCSICVSAVLGHVPPEGKVLLTHSPHSLHLKEGESATFTCNISALNYNPEDINWYRTENNTPIKIADLQSARKDDRLRITTKWNLRKAELRIENVTLSDSGNYYCGHLNVTASGKIIVSNSSELFVESFQSTSTEVIDLTNQTGPTSNTTALKMTMISTSILLTLLLLLLIGTAVTLVWHKQRHKKPQPQLRNLEKPPQDPEVYTVDYGVLEFGNSQPCRKSADLCILEHVEYATIMFPQEKPSTGERRGRAA